VFIYHLRLPLGPGSFWPIDIVVSRGYLGVDAFFVLSGLVLAHAHPGLQSSVGATWRFWTRRFLRIYPVHLVTILLLAAVAIGGAVLHLPPRDPGRFGRGELARHLLLVHGWGFSDRWAWNYPSWSVSTEWAGYLAFPLLWFLLRRASRGVCAAVLIAMVALLASVDMAEGPTGLNLSFHGALARFFPEFVAGMALARVAEGVPGRLRGGAVAAAGLAAALAALHLGRDWMVVGGIVLTLAGLLLAARQGRTAILARMPGLRTLGEVSFAFYMCFAIVETVQAFAWRRLGVAPADRQWLFVALSTLATLALALALRAWVERPALRLGRSLAAERPRG
jgi:peptidoglycan/LPS O-acetylase OafA/YrhL